jgi:CelD/BcsL family acetyltransferase involved in cellulose biosynthesis
MTQPTDAPARAHSRDGVQADVAWSAQVLTDSDAFGSLQQDWEDLYGRCPAATPFQSFAWLESWWHEYGRQSGGLRLVLVRAGGRLAAAAPLVLQRRGPWSVLTPLGGDESDFHDVLIDPTVATPAAGELAVAVAGIPGWSVLDIREARSDAHIHQLAASWPGARWRTRGAAGFEIPAGSVAEFLAVLPRSARKKVRGKLRKVDACGIEARAVTAGELPDAVRGLLRLHEQQWRGRAVNPEHLRDRYQRHLTRALGPMIQRGQAVLTQYRFDGELVVSDVSLIAPGFVGKYLGGFEPRMRQHVDVAVMMLCQALRLAERSGRPAVSLLRGDEPYKQRWHPTPVRSERLLLGRPDSRLPAVGYAMLVRGRTSVADLVRRRVPWLRSLRARARSIIRLMRAPGW